MAERRMFAKTIIDSDAFLDMPLSTQALYFHLSMRADDDGFINNPKKIQRMIGASEDDLKLLCAKRFIIPFESGIVVIKHWKIHNYIRNDRYKETVYQEEKALLTIKDNNAYTLDDNKLSLGIPNDNQMDTQVRLGKDRLVEDRSDQYKRSLLESEFDGVWNIYPKKQGKKEALEAYIRARKKGVSTVDILNGIAAYKNYINIEKIDEKYIKQGSTFFRQQAWQDDWTPKRKKVIDEQDDILDGIL